MKLQLPQVTLICITGLYYDVEGHKKAMQKSCEGIEFGSMRVVMDDKINDVDDHNKFLIYDLWKFVDTEFLFLIHADGFITNPQLWNPKWLEYDYCGSPWPLPSDNYSYRTPDKEIIRVGNSVGLRSKRLMEAPSKYNFEWKSYYGNTNEDGFLTVHNIPLISFSCPLKYLSS